MVHWIEDDQPLPPATAAQGKDDDYPGLVAAGGQVTPARLQEAYTQGIFPWYSHGQPVLWWSPDPRMVLYTAEFHAGHGLRKALRRFLRTPGFEVRFDSAFEAVMQACAHTPRPGQDGTWIVPEMLQAYAAWHRAGCVHSVETWIDGELAGGLYFVNLGRMCFGESMFTRRTDASKVALAAFVAACLARGIAMVDCQQNTGHLARLGGREIPRAAFLAHVDKAVVAEAPQDWSYDELAWRRLGLQAGEQPPARLRAPDPAADPDPDPRHIA